MDRLETQVSEREFMKSWLWLHYIDDVFFAWIYGEETFKEFLVQLSDFLLNLKFKSNAIKFSRSYCKGRGR